MTAETGPKTVTVPAKFPITLPKMNSAANMSSKHFTDEVVDAGKEEIKIILKKNEDKEDSGEIFLIHYLIVIFLIMNIIFGISLWLTDNNELLFENEEHMDSFSNFPSSV